MSVAILGLNAYHGDAAAALVVDGQLVAAAEEERFNRIKHWAGFPSESIRYCLEVGGIDATELDHVAISFDPRANFAKKARFLLRHRPSPRAIVDRLRRQRRTLSLEQQLAHAVSLDAHQLRAKFHRIEHHQAHVGAGFLISPFDHAAVLSIDGMGDFTSTLLAHASDRSWTEVGRVYFPHSIGLLYSAITMYLGFPYYGDEYKVMGLAPYGEPEFADVLRKLIRPSGELFELGLEYFTHHRRGIRMTWNEGAPVVHPFHSELLDRALGPMRGPDEPVTQKHENIAKSLQVVTEEIILHLVRTLAETTGETNLCITGGVAMNSVANGKIAQQSSFEDVYIPAGAADNGTSFGAAFFVWNRLLGNPRQFVQLHAYLGTEASSEECAVAIRDASLPFETLDEESLVATVVDLLVHGHVVGWFQGRMEFGARALGNRTLLADPRRTDMRDIINTRIKFREKFRPFAPSILEEHIGEWFEVAEASPYMERVLPIRPEKQSEIPAVTHIDGSGRLQSVSKHTNPLYYRLIARFFDKTGVPMLLNTSLNENEPIVRTPQEALSCFQRTAMDAIVLADHLIVRNRLKKTNP